LVPLEATETFLFNIPHHLKPGKSLEHLLQFFSFKHLLHPFPISALFARNFNVPFASVSKLLAKQCVKSNFLHTLQYKKLANQISRCNFF